MSEIDYRKYSDYTYDKIKNICEDIGPGCPCSKEERKRAMFIKNEMEECCDEIEVQEFECAPKAYLGWFKIGCYLSIIGVIFMFISFSFQPILFTLIALVFLTFIFLIMLNEFILSKEFIDRFYKKKGSLNVIGKIKPAERVDNIVIFSGHHDSALQFTWLRYAKFGYYLAVFFLIFTVAAYFILLVFRFIYLLLSINAVWNTNVLIFFSYTFLPLAMISGLFFVGSDKDGGQVPGATDNLAAVFIAISIGRMLKKNPDLIPENTEVRLVSFGSEEANIRGSRAFVKENLAELKEKNAICLNFESIVGPEMTVYTSDSNGFKKMDKESVELVYQAGLNANVPIKKLPFPIGGGATDTLPFAENNVRGVCLFSMKIPSDMMQFYHQEFDSYDKLNKDGLVNAMKVGIEFLKLLKTKN